MSRLLISGDALARLKNELANQNADAARIFTIGGCCSRFEIAPAKKALAGDVACEQDGIKLYIERELAENASCIEIRFDEKKGLIIELRE